MLYDKGIAMIVKKAGMAISSFFQSIEPSVEAINTPTIIRAGAVTDGVITLSSGEKNNATIKRSAVTTDVKPVRPPAATPEADST